jgi:signal peptidase II
MMGKKTQSQLSENAAQTQTVRAAFSWPAAVALFWPIAICGAIFDLWSKAAIFDSLERKIQVNSELIVTGIHLLAEDKNILSNITPNETELSDLNRILISEKMYNFIVENLVTSVLPKDEPKVTKYYYDEGKHLSWSVDYFFTDSKLSGLEMKSSSRKIIIPNFIDIIARENEGAAFSLFRGWTTLLVVISAAALVVVVAVFFFGKIHRRLVLFSLGCMTAGIIGNLYDRAFNDGRVRDFIDVYVGAYHWPTFNVADSLLCIGVGLLIIANLTADSADNP